MWLVALGTTAAGFLLAAAFRRAIAPLPLDADLELCVVDDVLDTASLELALHEIALELGLLLDAPDLGPLVGRTARELHARFVPPGLALPARARAALARVLVVLAAMELAAVRKRKALRAAARDDLVVELDHAMGQAAGLLRARVRALLEPSR